MAGEKKKRCKKTGALTCVLLFVSTCTHGHLVEKRAAAVAILKGHVNCWGQNFFAAGSLSLRKKKKKKKSFSAMTVSCLHVAWIKPHLTSTNWKHFCSNLAVRQRIYLGFTLRHLLSSNVRHGDVFSCETNSPESSVFSIGQRLRYHNFCRSEDTAELPLPHLFLK